MWGERPNEVEVTVAAVSAMSPRFVYVAPGEEGPVFIATGQSEGDVVIRGVGGGAPPDPDPLEIARKVLQ